MEKLRERIKDEILPHLKLNAYEMKNKSYKILEDSDLFGFSGLKHQSGSSVSFQKDDIIDAFRSDESWHNPGSVDLMMRSYEITDPYGSVLFDSIVENSSSFNYLHIKAQQNRLFASKAVEEGMLLLNHGRIADSIKKFTCAIAYDEVSNEAYFARANAYVRLRDWRNAIQDLEKSIEINSDDDASKELLKSVRQIAGKSLVSLKNNGSDKMQPSSVSTTFIEKLKNSLEEETVINVSDNSPKSNRVVADSSGSDDSDRSEIKKRKRKHKNKSKKDKKRKEEKHKKKKRRRSEAGDDSSIVP
jgi:tetratricopeptide (TPR) repeat protein